MIIIQGRELLFDNYCWHEYVKRVDFANMAGSSNQAGIYAALAAAAYTNGTEKPDWKEAGEWVRSLSVDEIKKFVTAFEEMQEYKTFVAAYEKALKEELEPVERKKKQSKASGKTLK